jgi:hypothetical protein
MKTMLGNFCIAILYSTSKNALSSSLCLCLFFNKINDKGRTGSAWKWGGGEWGEIVKEGGSGEKWPKQCMHMWINELKNKNKGYKYWSNSHLIIELFKSLVFMILNFLLFSFCSTDFKINDCIITSSLLFINW